MWQAAILPLVSGGVTAHGAIKANAQNTATKASLGYKARSVEDLAGPLGDSIQGGYQPGGFLRSALYGTKAAPVNQAYNTATGGLENGSWRYGGGQGGLARARWLEAMRTRGAGLADAQMGADTTADDALSRMQTLARGYKESMAPATVYDNPYKWVWPTVQAAQQGAQSQGGTW